MLSSVRISTIDLLSLNGKIMQEKTDDEHSLTLQQIMHELEANDISAERKSLYDDFKCMDEHLGIEVIDRFKFKSFYLSSIYAIIELKL